MLVWALAAWLLVCQVLGMILAGQISCNGTVSVDQVSGNGTVLDQVSGNGTVLDQVSDNGTVLDQVSNIRMVLGMVLVGQVSCNGMDLAGQVSCNGMVFHMVFRMGAWASAAAIR
jgi:hypothetical protein